MLRIDKKTAEVEAREDIALLLKGYAREGYKQFNNGTDTGFESLWQVAFPVSNNGNGSQEPKKSKIH